jgi:hypothetical protein
VPFDESGSGGLAAQADWFRPEARLAWFKRVELVHRAVSGAYHRQDQ